MAAAAFVPPACDPSSLSNPQEAHATHLSWDAVVDFEKHQFFAKATYDVKVTSSDVSSLRLDTSGLDVRSVQVDGAPASFSMSVPDASKPHLGSCLEIELNGTTSDKISVDIEYATSPSASAAQWLPPAQTAGKEHPYVFTQCQAIHARSLLPCQDCPAVKMTYDARVTVPGWATCVMSALSKDAEKTNTVTEAENGDKIYEFAQPVPIPSYLFALAVGRLDSRDISPRCRVWSEPSTVDAVAFEFSQVEDFLKAAEELTMPYQWTRYDLLCLPPSFPYGGMENPCLTFVTPTLLAGDRSLADVVAHEAAHSWSGNLVTNETWEHFWLNEGWTMFLQRKIMAKVHGNDKFFDFDAIGGWEDLKESVALLPDKYTKLIPDLGDDDPDDAFSSVPYEKGFNLLYALERLVGADKFAVFMKAYFDNFKFSTVTSQSFVEFFESHFEDVPAIKEFDWKTWLHEPGMPEAPTFDRTLSAECEGLADAWISVDDGETAGGVLPKHDISDWSTGRKTCFLDSLIGTCTERKRPLSLSTVASMKEMYRMHQSKNSEVLFRFCMLAVEAGDESILPVVVRFVTTQGRMKFLRPLYRAMFRSGMGRDVAVSTFLGNRDFYHPIAAKMVASDLDSTKSEKKKTLGGLVCGLPRPLVIGGVLVLSAAVGVALLRGKRR
eukprot:CAMPEP_0172574672 /NCGR_PEP_ID=MMETSP1067-20121228/136821_1 /TAXON_ID=265564 ORGANISM="Thalassiosira punctigera, Strain Tpunct2005C2" /NCGR_SAMPLE_ID=MMETSP1067 /ASSEMBLY_ACC=CAM_ASM_000444 /LENGTH=665 /DNA_ID=CAMNT_0013367305 /DNA_START=11 /DNA_END=2008 /DNA_ORIENTATION=-